MPELTKNAKPAGGAYFKNILSILFFDFVYGWYLTGRSNSVLLSTIDFLWVKQSKPSLPWYEPIPLSPKPPKPICEVAR